jgi:hypothetical protein
VPAYSLYSLSDASHTNRDFYSGSNDKAGANSPSISPRSSNSRSQSHAPISPASLSSSARKAASTPSRSPSQSKSDISPFFSPSATPSAIPPLLSLSPSKSQRPYSASTLIVRDKISIRGVLDLLPASVRTELEPRVRHDDVTAFLHHGVSKLAEKGVAAGMRMWNKRSLLLTTSHIAWWKTGGKQLSDCVPLYSIDDHEVHASELHIRLLGSRLLRFNCSDHRTALRLFSSIKELRYEARRMHNLSRTTARRRRLVTIPRHRSFDDIFAPHDDDDDDEENYQEILMDADQSHSLAARRRSMSQSRTSMPVYDECVAESSPLRAAFYSFCEQHRVHNWMDFLVQVTAYHRLYYDLLSSMSPPPTPLSTPMDASEEKAVPPLGLSLPAGLNNPIPSPASATETEDGSSFSALTPRSSDRTACNIVSSFTSESRRGVTGLAVAICRDYIQSATAALPITDSARQDIAARSSECDLHLFDDAAEVVDDLLRDRWWPQFVATDSCMQALVAMEESSNIAGGFMEYAQQTAVEHSHHDDNGSGGADDDSKLHHAPTLVRSASAQQLGTLNRSMSTGSLQSIGLRRQRSAERVGRGHGRGRASVMDNDRVHQTSLQRAFEGVVDLAHHIATHIGSSHDRRFLALNRAMSKQHRTNAPSPVIAATTTTTSTNTGQESASMMSILSETSNMSLDSECPSMSDSSHSQHDSVDDSNLMVPRRRPAQLDEILSSDVSILKYLLQSMVRSQNDPARGNTIHTPATTSPRDTAMAELDTQIHSWIDNKPEDFAQTVISVLGEPDPRAHDLAVRVMFVTLSQANKSANRPLSMPAVQRTARQLVKVVARHCWGTHAGETVEMHVIVHSLFLCLSRNIATICAGEPLMDVTMLGASVVNASVWPALFTAIRLCDEEQAISAFLGEVFLLLLNRKSNTLSIVDDKEWATWLTPFLESESVLIRRHAYNVLCTTLTMCAFHTEKFESVLRSALGSIPARFHTDVVMVIIRKLNLKGSSSIMMYPSDKPIFKSLDSLTDYVCRTDLIQHCALMQLMHDFMVSLIRPFIGCQHVDDLSNTIDTIQGHVDRLKEHLHAIEHGSPTKFATASLTS